MTSDKTSVQINWIELKISDVAAIFAFMFLIKWPMSVYEFWSSFRWSLAQEQQARLL